ncbi:hypothetical protein LSTR_LSTR015242 [Laodelphax striatellus]|uniref:Uncharacterized protein n=1 Tax=Laodelphax striatellus TaxID=195883 RepID=A0A482XQC3_LAOST|nr:hypothetical protein LSTR_LSTR015242 [Laodelphax striatellus]
MYLSSYKDTQHLLVTAWGTTEEGDKNEEKGDSGWKRVNNKEGVNEEAERNGVEILAERRNQSTLVLLAGLYAGSRAVGRNVRSVEVQTPAGQTATGSPTPSSSSPSTTSGASPPTRLTLLASFDKSIHQIRDCLRASRKLSVMTWVRA